ncbi:peptidylprolyl isomerase [bacterium]|nr:peptidylprolyl isomerase [bacterium]
MPGMIRTLRIPILLTMIALLAVACSNPRTEPVLEVGESYELPIASYEALAARRFNSAEIAETEPISSHEAYLNEILVRQLKVIDGRHKGYDQDPKVQEDYEQGLQRAAITKLYNDEVLSKVIPESEMRDFYKHDTHEVHASHILIRTEEGTDDGSKKALIDSIYTLATTGSDFAELANKYNEDTSTQQGDIGWFRRGVMVLPFEEAAFGLNPGDVSEPVNTRFGWHIIKLHEKRKIEDRPSFEDDKERISKQIARQRSEELVDRAQEFIEGLRADRDVEIDTTRLEQLMKKLQGRVTTPDVVSLLTEEEQNQVVTTLDGGTIELTLDDMREAVNQMAGRLRRFDDVSQMYDIINGYVAQNHLLPDAARKEGCFDDEAVLEAAKDAADRRIYQIVQQNIVSNRIEPTEEQLREYFEEHPEKYMIDAQYTLIECLLDDKQTATDIFRRASQGENLRDLANKYTKRVTVKNGVFGPIRRTQYGAVGRLASESEIGKLVGPVRIGNDWSVFRVISKEEPKLDEFENVKSRVRNDLRIKLRTELDEAWLDSLKQNIDYSINLNVLKKAYPNAKAPSDNN